MKYKDLRDFIAQLEQNGQLRRISHEIDPYLEMTEISDRTLRAGGPALLFENPKGYTMPVLTNLFGTPDRVAMGMGQPNVSALRQVGTWLSYLKEPEPPRGLKGADGEAAHLQAGAQHADQAALFGPLSAGGAGRGRGGSGSDPHPALLARDVAPLVTWGLTITRGPYKKRQNLGIYRQQKIGKNKLIMRWLDHRGGAIDFREWQEAHPGERFPVAVALGADPATILGAVTPVPDSLSEYAFAGLLRGSRTEVVKALSCDLEVPASAEIVLEGYLEPGRWPRRAFTAITPATTTKWTSSRSSPSPT